MKKRYLALLLGVMLLVGGCSGKEEPDYNTCNLATPDDCMLISALTNKNELICKGVKDSDKYNECISAIAKIKENATVCAKSNDPLTANACVSQIAILTTDPVACDQTAETNKRINQKDLCFVSLAAESKNLSHCELIQGAEVKQRCLDLINIG
jgi:hypothetical protein